MRRYLSFILPFVTVGILMAGLISMNNSIKSNDNYAGGLSSHLSYVTGLVVSLDSNNNSLQMRISKQDEKLIVGDLITVDCTDLHPTELNYSFKSISEGDEVTIGYFSPLTNNLKAFCITSIYKEDNEMKTDYDLLSRRNLMKLGVIGFTGIMASGIKSPLPAFASTPSPRNINPRLQILVKNPKTGKTLNSLSQYLDLSKNTKITSNESIKILKYDTEYSNGSSVYSINTAINLDGSTYVEETEESSESLNVYAKITLGVLWGENKDSIQIQRGTFSVTQKNPLIPFYNTSYAMMQKTHYITDFFNGNETTIETNWPIDPYDSSTDQYTCGGAVIGGCNNILTGEEYSFAVELYL